MVRKSSPVEIIRKTSIDNLSFIPAGPILPNPSELIESGALDDLINYLKKEYDYIIIDCPPALDPRTVNALTACDLLIIPTQAEYFSANSIRKMLDLIRYIRKEANPLLAYRILITMLDLRNGIHVRVSDLFQKKFEACLFKTQIEIDTHLRDSQTAGVPITNYMPSSRGSLQYSNLAQEISEYVEKRSRNQA